MWNFMRALGKAHGKKALQTVIDKTVEADPTTATAAQLEVMEDDLKKASLFVGKCQQAATKERREAENLRARFKLQGDAARILFAEHEDPATSPTRKTELAASLTEMTAELEELQAQLTQEEQEAAEAEEMLKEAEQALREKGQALLTAKKQLEKGANNLQRAKMRRDRAEQKAEQAAELAGLREGKSTSMNAALKALENQAARAEAEAAAASRRAEALSAPQLGSDKDPNVARALEQAKRGLLPNQSQDIGSRLAALTGHSIEPKTALPSPATVPASEQQATQEKST